MNRLSRVSIYRLLLYKARLIIETCFENWTVRRSKLGVCLILEVLGSQYEIRSLTLEFFYSER